MNIGLDFDGVCTHDPHLFKLFANATHTLGHKVYLVTMRYPSECGDLLEMENYVEGVHATSRRAKAPYMEAQGITIHIWIDDNPRAINEHATAIWPDPAPEGCPVIPEHSMEGVSLLSKSNGS